MSHPNKPVFHDHTGKRWKTLVHFMTGVALLLSILGAAFSFSVIALPLSPLSIKYPSYVHRFIPRFETHTEAARRFVANRTRAKLRKAIALEETFKHKKHIRSSGAPYSTVVGFYVNWNPASFDSLNMHIDKLTYIMPEWLYLNPDASSFSSRYGDSHDDWKVVNLAKKHGVPIIPMLDNVANHAFNWDRLRTLLASSSAQEKLARNLKTYLLAKHFGGINIDLEVPSLDGLTPAQKRDAQRLVHDGLPRLMGTLMKTFKPAHLLVTQDIPPDDPKFDYNKLDDVNDFVVVMLYDQNTKDGDPGPIASQQWIEQMADKVFSKMDSEKVVLGLGNFCYDWRFTTDSDGNMHSLGGAWAMSDSNSQPSESEALGRANDAGATIKMDPDDLNPYFTYSDNNNVDHIVYMLDAVTAYNQIIALKGYQPRGAALWRLGSEDPSIWSFFAEGKLGKPAKLSALSEVNYHSVQDEGSGEIEEVVARPEPGLRKIKLDNDGLIVDEPFVKYPRPFILRHTGDAAKKIALSFDDGPDPDYTPRILRILKEYKVPATFFVVGKNAENNREIVREAWQDGNEIGNHTYSHPILINASALRAELEVNATQRLIESITGYSTRLFRPPYGDGADVNATDTRGVSMLERMQKLGYITVGFNIDPADFSRPGVSEILRRVNAQLNRGNIVLLHDAGGNRDETVAALPLIIKDLRSRGYQFVRVSDLIGKNGHSRMFSPVEGAEETIAGIDRVVFEGGFILTRILQIIFLTALALGIFRILLVAPLALIQSRRSRQMENENFTPPVTVIVPAYNEDKVVCRTIRGILESDYLDIRVLVIDDGSTDDTAEEVRRSFANEERLTYVHKENGGKASALNLGISMAETEIVVCCDADTIFARDAIRHLVRQFTDPKVGAIAGNVKVGNRMNPLTVWQSVEYITSQNFDRRAYAALNSVAVIPGAIGAWRKSVVMRAGGYQTDTLAEDADLTFRIRLLGYDTRTQNDAYAYTEAPDTVATLAKQRFRWAFGILQTLWKHKDTLLRRRYGAFGMFVVPAMWIFNIIFQALSPVVDVAVVIALFSHNLLPVFGYFAALFTLDFLASWVAFKLDVEDPRQLAWLFWQRFFYRQFMYYVIIKSIIAALRGELVGWGKLQRKATATLPTAGE